MIPRIKSFETNDNWKLTIVFDDGLCVSYDVKNDIDNIDDFKTLISDTNLWNMAQLDTSRTCIYWNDRIDLPSDILYEYGVPLSQNYK